MGDREAAPLLAETLSVIVPKARQTRLLRACLHAGGAGRRAWQDWQALMGNAVRGNAALDSRPFPAPHANAPAWAMWARVRAQSLDGIGAGVLSPTDSLLHVCGRAAFSAGRGSLLWVSDAWQIMQEHRGRDWGVFLESASLCRPSLVLYSMLHYLATELEAPIPPSIVSRLATAADVDALGREGALRAARTGPSGSLANLFRQTRRWEDQARLLKRWLLPSPSYLRAVHELRPAASIPLSYVCRPFRYGARRISAGITSAMATRATWPSCSWRS